MSLYLGNIKIPDVEFGQIQPPAYYYVTEDIIDGDLSPYPEGSIIIVIGKDDKEDE